MPKNGERHQCELLDYLGRYLEYMGPVNHPEMHRWQFIMPHKASGIEDMVYLDCVLFCPCCGEDFREDTGIGLAGRPKLQECIVNAKNTGEKI